MVQEPLLGQTVVFYNVPVRTDGSIIWSAGPLLPKPRRWKLALVCTMFLVGGFVLLAVFSYRVGWAERIAVWMHQ